MDAEGASGAAVQLGLVWDFLVSQHNQDSALAAKGTNRKNRTIASSHGRCHVCQVPHLHTAYTTATALYCSLLQFARSIVPPYCLHPCLALSHCTAGHTLLSVVLLAPQVALMHRGQWWKGGCQKWWVTQSHCHPTSWLHWALR